jgi:hypothetical protein
MTYSFLQDDFVRATLEVSPETIVMKARHGVDTPEALGHWPTLVPATGHRRLFFDRRRLW